VLGASTQQLLTMSFDRGVPADGLLFFAMRQGGELLLVDHVCVFGFLVATALFVRAVCREVGLSEAAAFAVAGLAVAYPGNQSWVVLCTSQYAFYAASSCAPSVPRATPPSRFAALRWRCSC
jgi:hypothetical protein